MRVVRSIRGGDIKVSLGLAEPGLGIAQNGEQLAIDPDGSVADVLIDPENLGRPIMAREQALDPRDLIERRSATAVRCSGSSPTSQKSKRVAIASREQRIFTGSSVAADLINPRLVEPVGGGDFEADGPGLDSRKVVASESLMVLDHPDEFDLATVIGFGHDRVVANRLGLRSADHLGAVRVGRGQGQLAVEPGIKGDLNLSDRGRLGPGQLDPGLATAHPVDPSMVERANRVAGPAIDDTFRLRPFG